MTTTRRDFTRIRNSWQILGPTPLIVEAVGADPVYVFAAPVVPSDVSDRVGHLLIPGTDAARIAFEQGGYVYVRGVTGRSAVLITPNAEPTPEPTPDPEPEPSTGTPTSALVTDVAFSQTIPFAGNSRMPEHAVTGALTFAHASSGSLAGAGCYLRLVADGTHLPDFSAFLEWGGSAGYDNTAGAVNLCQFFFDGDDHFVCITQPLGQGQTGGTPSTGGGSTPDPTPAPTQKYLRLGQLNGMTEAASGDGYVYTPTFDGEYSGNYGLTTTAIPANADGFIGQTTDMPNAAGPIVGLTVASAPGNFDAMPLDYGLYVYVNGSVTYYRCITNGQGAGAPDTQVAFADGDLVRLRRSGTSIIGEVSKDQGTTWVTAKTWTGAPSGALRGFFQTGEAVAPIRLPFGSVNMA